MAVYVREELGYKTDLTYVLLSREANNHWDWGRGSGRDNASVDDDLRTLLTLDPSFRLLVVHGYADMVTPYAVSRYVLDHLPDFPESRARAAQGLSRRPHVLYRRRFAPALHRRRPFVLRGRAVAIMRRRIVRRAPV